MIGDKAAEFTELLENSPENFNVKSVNEKALPILVLYATPCKILNLKVSN